MPSAKPWAAMSSSTSTRSSSWPTSRGAPRRGHYVLVDDKTWIFSAVKGAWGSRVTTVFVRQGQPAHDAAAIAGAPWPDVTEHIRRITGV
jgi:hypothetical protein